MIEIQSDQRAGADERIPLFSIDGQEYTMPAEIGAELALAAIDRLRTMPAEAVEAWLLEEVVGSKAYRALLGCKGLKRHQLKAVMVAVREHVMGPLEEEGKG